MVVKGKPYGPATRVKGRGPTRASIVTVFIKLGLRAHPNCRHVARGRSIRVEQLLVHKLCTMVGTLETITERNGNQDDGHQ